MESFFDLSRLVVYPEGNDGAIYRGCIVIHNESFGIRFSNPLHLACNIEQNKQQKVICELDARLSQILHHCTPMIEKRLFDCKTPEQFLTELYNILHKTLDICSITRSISSVFYAKICRELDAIGWQCVAQISSDMTQFVLNTKPNINHSKSMQHQLYFHIIDPNHFPTAKPLLIAKSLPCAFEYEWNAANTDCSHIANAVTQYNKQCTKYKLFWKIVDDFYKRSIVLEPQTIDYGTNTLRILLDKEKKTTIQIKLNTDPLECKQMQCQCQFYGIKEEVAVLEERWNSDKICKWNGDVFPRINIEDILGIGRFITSDSVSHIISDMECSICLEFKAENDSNSIPNVVCKSCTKSFHKNCLMEWFSSLDTVHHQYTSIQGKCPQCSHVMSFAINDQLLN